MHFHILLTVDFYLLGYKSEHHRLEAKGEGDDEGEKEPAENCIHGGCMVSTVPLHA